MAQYKHPPIIASYAQILLNWDFNEMQASINSIRDRADLRYEAIIERTTQNLEIRFDNETVIQEQSAKFGGIECRLATGGICLVEETGLRYWMTGAYQGRDQLFEEVLWWYDEIKARSPKINATRASILIENLILPNEEDTIFRIEDYVAPKFELADPDLDKYIAYQHRVTLNLEERTGHPMHAILNLESGFNEDQRATINVKIDTLHRNPSLFPNLRDCFVLIKNEESHIFESVITDKTRRIYGHINSQ